jgi:glycosyltransferase involved in cell wall biosynthesis
MRVLAVIKCLGYGGAERLLVDLMATRDRQDFDYEVAFVLSAEHTLVPDIRASGVTVHDLGATHNGDLRWMPRFRHVLLAGDFDVVHFHLPYSAGLGRLVIASLPRHRRPAVVYTEHSLWYQTALPVRAVNRATIGRDQALVVVSEAAREALPDNLKSRAEVVIHGVQLSRSDEISSRRDDVRRQVRAELGVGDEDLLALTVSNFRAEKGYDVLLDAARLIADRGRPIRFAAIGRGPLAEELEARRLELGLDDTFQFLGARADVLRWLTGADVFVLPSRYEGLPVALMEAMSVGRAIVATAVGGVPQVLTDETDALLVPPERPDALAEALERLQEDPALVERLGKGARDRSTIFDVSRTSRRMEQIYRQLAGPSATARPRAGRPTTAEPLVLHVIPTATARGAQREARALADALDTPGVRRHRVLCLFGGDREVASDYELDLATRGRPAAGFDPRVVRPLRALLTRLDPAVVIAHGSDPLKYLVPASVGRRGALVYYAIGVYAGDPSRRLQRSLWRFLAARADVVAACGPDVEDECISLLGVPRSRVALVANGRDPAVFRPPARRAGGSPLVIFVGALVPNKRPERFVELVRRLRARGLDFRAQIIGDGPRRAALAGPASEARVELLGSRADVAELMGQADLLVFPSLPAGEGLPGVLVEAGLCGLPVVATAVPGVRNIVKDGVTGLVTGIDDLDAMESAAVALLEDPERRTTMGVAAREHCLANFSVAEVADRWSAVLRPLLGDHGASRPSVDT